MSGRLLLSGFVGGILLGVVCWLLWPTPTGPQRSAAELMDVIMWGKEPIGGPFELIDHNGQRRTDAVVFVVVPFKNGTVCKGPTVPGLLGLVHRMVPPFWVVVAPLPLKANRAGGALFGELAVMSTATVRKLGLDDPGVMPVTVPKVGVALVTAVPVTGLRVALVKNGTGPGLAVTFVKAADVIGVTAVTTVVPPGCPLTPLMTLVKAEFTPVTHVSAEAVDNSAAFRLTTLTVSRRKRRPVMSLLPCNQPCPFSSINPQNDCNAARGLIPRFFTQ